MQAKRYVELDWLRVLLILAVFLHHVFMPFNGDGWHVVNNESSKLLDDIMVYFEQLRLQILFFIAGAGSYLFLYKYSVIKFMQSKFHRLFVPLIFAMMFIVPPQIYFENINDYQNIVTAYQDLIFAFNANHLWFIEFLFVFMMLAIPLYYMLHRGFGKVLSERLEKLATRKHGLFSIVLLAITLRLTLKLLMPSQSNDISNLSVSLFFFLFFVAGMCFIKNDRVWMVIKRYRCANLHWFVLSTLVFYAYYFTPDLSDYLSLEVRWQLWWLVCTLVSWSGLLALLGYASVYCKNAPKWLLSMNELIYPFYIIHQTVIVVFAFYIVQWDAGIATKSITLLAASLIVCCIICFGLIRPVNALRYVFGLKKK